MSLHLFHLAIQIVMPWENYHLHEFLIGDERWGVIGPAGYRPGMGVRDEREATLADLLPGAGFTFRYMYDWGDLWWHELVVKEVLPPGEGPTRPRCAGGGSAAPPEDCGGVDGFYELLVSLQDPAHPEHERKKQWMGGGFDPDLFSTLVADQLLRYPPEPRQWEPASQNPAEFFNYLVHRAIEEERPELRRKRDFKRFMKVQEHRFEELADPDFGGLSPRQFRTLEHDGWDRPKSAMKFVRTLRTEELSGVTAFEHARGLLETISAGGGCVPAREGGTFESAFVSEILSRREWSEWLPEDWEPAPAGGSEDTENPVNELGRRLGERGLLRVRRGRICLTRRGRRILAPERAGDLLAEMFQAIFAGSPVSVDGSGQMVAMLRRTAAFVLWRFHVLPFQWYDTTALAVETLPWNVVRTFFAAWEGATAEASEEAEVTDPWSAVTVVLDGVVLSSLHDFALLERREEGKGGAVRSRSYRRSPLLEQFIRFEGLPDEPFLVTEWLER